MLTREQMRAAAVALNRHGAGVRNETGEVGKLIRAAGDAALAMAEATLSITDAHVARTIEILEGDGKAPADLLDLLDAYKAEVRDALNRAVVELEHEASS